MSGHPGPPWDVLSGLSSVAKRDLGECKDLSDTTKSNQSLEVAWMRWEPATTSPVPHLLSSPIISQHLAVSRQDPWDSYCLLSCALPYLRSIFHVRRSHVSGYLWPWGPGSAGLGHVCSITSETPSGAQINPALQETPCLSFPAGKSEGKETPFLNIQ